MDELANVWPQGGLFAFSGVDGPTCHSEPFVAAGALDGIGWRFWLTPRFSLYPTVEDSRVEALRNPADFCLCDCWRCSFASSTVKGVIEGAFLDRASFLTVIRPDGDAAAVRIAMTPDRDGVDREGVAVYPGEGWWVAVSPSGGTSFGVAISYKNEDEAVARAQQAAGAPVSKAIEDRQKFIRWAGRPKNLAGDDRRTYCKALSVQKVNVESPQKDIPCRWTTPDRMPHRHMWLWDSAFHAVGLQHTDIELAHDAIRALFAKQRADGKLLLAAQPGTPAREEDDSQPPIVAFAVHQLAQRNDSAAFANEVYANLVRYLDWFEANRRNDTGLYGWQVRAADDSIKAARGGESGMDNSPRFDDALSITAVDLAGYMASEYWCMERLANLIGRGSDIPEWKSRRAKISQLANDLLWDDETRFYYDLDEAGELLNLKTSAGFMPLFGRIPDRDRAEALRMHLMNPNEFWSPFPVCSVSQDEPSYSQDMWRGPTWPNVNLLLYHALLDYGFLQEARLLGRVTIQEIARHYFRSGCFHEFYDAAASLPPAELPRKGAPGEKGGVGFGVVADLHWTAATYIHLVNELG